MSMNLNAAIRLTAKVDGANNIKALSGGLQQLNSSAQLSKASLGRWNVEINRSARAAGNTTAGIRAHAAALTQLRDRVEIGSRSYARLSREIEAANSKLRALNGTAARSPRGGGAGGLLAAGAAGAGAFAAFQASQQIGATVNAGIDLEQSRTRLRALSAGYDEYAAVQQRAIQVGEKFNLQQLEANNSFAQLYARLRPLGIELDTITSIYGGFNTAAKLSGTTASEAKNAFIQLSQALGSGVLRGEELNSVYEQTPAVIREIAKVMGLPIGQLRDYAKEGKITSDIVITALGNIEREGAAKLAEAMNGPREQVNLLQREFQELQDVAARQSMPAIMASIGLLRGAVEGLTGEVKANALAWKGLAESPIGQFFEGIRILVSGLNIDLMGTRRHIDGIVSVIPGIGGLQTLGLWRDNLAGGRSGNGLLPGASGLTLRSSAADYPSLSSGNALGTPVGAAVGGGSGGSGGGASRSPAFKLSSKGKALVAAARTLGISPLDLAVIIEFESGGDPSKWGGDKGKHMGLIQFGGPERQQYGARPGQSFEEQVQGPVVRFLQDRFKREGRSTQGASLLDLYRTVLGGNPNADINKEDAFGTTPASGVNRMKGLRNVALDKYFGGTAANVPYDSVDAGRDAADRLKAEDELNERRLEAVKIGKEELAQSSAQLQIETASNELQRLDLEFAEKRRKLAVEFARAKSEAEALRLGPDDIERIDERRAIEAAILQNTYQREYNDILQKQNELWRQQGEALSEVTAQAFEFARARQEGADIRGGFNDGINGYLEGIGTIRSSVTDLATNAFTGLENALVDLVTTGKAGFKELAASILADTARMIIQQYVLANVLQGVRGLLGGGGGGLPAFAPGLNLGTSFGGSGFNPAAFSPGLDLLGGGGAAIPIPVTPFKFANGGVIDSPTLFKFATGGSFRNGLMGEAGPEAIMPLRRGPDGKLGVSGGGGTSVVVNVNMQTGQSDVQSSEGDGRRLGRAVSEAVQAELIKQRRPGGLIYS